MEQGQKTVILYLNQEKKVQNKVKTDSNYTIRATCRNSESYRILFFLIGEETWALEILSVLDIASILLLLVGTLQQVLIGSNSDRLVEILTDLYISPFQSGE